MRSSAPAFEFKTPANFTVQRHRIAVCGKPHHEEARQNRSTKRQSGDIAPDRFRVCAWNSPYCATANTAAASAVAGGAAARRANDASSGTTGDTISVYGDCVLQRQHYRIWHSRLERHRRRGSGSFAARNAHSDYESCALQRNVLGSRHGGRNTQTPFGRLSARLRRGATIRPPIRSRDRHSGPALTGS